MKRTLPLILAMITGFIVLISDFIPHWPFGMITSEIEKWFLIISGFALILGQINLIKVNVNKIRFKAEGWQYFIITIASFAIMVLFGALWGTQSNVGLLGNGTKIVEVIGSKPFDYLFDNVYQHLQATMFSLLAFFIASAAFTALFLGGWHGPFFDSAIYFVLKMHIVMLAMIWVRVTFFRPRPDQLIRILLIRPGLKD